jgi:hypothetical protein
MDFKSALLGKKSQAEKPKVLPLQPETHPVARPSPPICFDTVEYKLNGRVYTFENTAGNVLVSGNLYHQRIIDSIQRDIFPNISQLTRPQAEKLIMIASQKIQPMGYEERMLYNFCESSIRWGKYDVRRLSELRDWLVTLAKSSGFTIEYRDNISPAISFGSISDSEGIMLRIIVSHSTLPIWKGKKMSIVFDNKIFPTCEAAFPEELSHPLWNVNWKSEYDAGLTRNIPFTQEHFLQWLTDIR